MKIYCFDNKAHAGDAAAASIAKVLLEKPNAVLGLATGSSPLETYRALGEMCRAGDISFANAKSINLDEYVGLSSEHEQSYARFMRENLFGYVDIHPKNTNIPNGLAEDTRAECRRYDELVESLGYADVQLLGIGHNGHIGFNEPSDSFTCGTQLVNLTESTVRANARFFESESDVPRQALSMGIDQIMKAGKIILLANGADKADIVERALFGEVTPRVPASALRLAKNVEVFLDADAARVILEKHRDSVEVVPPVK